MISGRIASIVYHFICFILTILIAYLIVQIGYSYFTLRLGKEEVFDIAFKGKPQKVLEKKTLADYLSVAKKKPFGEPAVNAGGDSKAKKEPEPTTLKVKLLGTILGDSSGLGAVILDEKSKSQEFFRVGDAVQGAKIVSIERGRVILKVGEQEQVLTFEEPGKGRPALASPQKVSKAEVSSAEIQLQRPELEAQMQDLPKLMSQVNLAPHFKDGQPAGIAVQRIAPGSIFQKMGLQNGDVVVSVDGNVINSPEDLITLYDRLKNAEEISIQVERQGMLKDIVYKIR